MTSFSVFSALAHAMRLRCLRLLLEHQELGVGELTHATGAAQRHSAQRGEWGLVIDRREGLWVYSRVHPELPEWAGKVLRDTCVADQDPFNRDIGSVSRAAA